MTNESVLAAPKRPRFATTTPVQKTKPLTPREARGAERRKTHPTMSAVQTSGQCKSACPRSGRSAPQTAPLARRICFRGALAFRRTAAALVRAATPALSSRPCFLGRPHGGRYPPARKPSSGTAPFAAAVVPQGVMPGAARERFARPRAGAASRSAIRIASGMRPSMSEIRHGMYFI